MNQHPINDLIHLRITRQLYQHASAAIFSSILNCLIVGIVFRNIVDPRINFGWVAICLIYMLFRYIFIQWVLKKKINLKNYRRRLFHFGLTICISGILFGSAGILYLSLERPAYNAFIFFLLGGIFAGSMGAFAIEKRVFAAFSAPVILPVTIYSFILGGEINTAMATMGIIFIAMMMVVVRPMNTSMVAAFRLDIQNAQLAEDTQRLNEALLVANDKFRRLSFYDTLTNATNRRFINDVLQHEVDRFTFSRRQCLTTAEAATDSEKSIYGLYVIDIDHFKQVNDTWGHKCGDQVLIQFVERLKSLVRKNDVVTRWGGEEFVIVLKRIKPDYLHTFARKVIQAVASEGFDINGVNTVRQTCSIGFAQLPFFATAPEVLSLEQTFEICDAALYHAKENGRNQAICAVHHAPSAQVISSEKGARIVQNLSGAIENDEVRLIPCVEKVI